MKAKANILLLAFLLISSLSQAQYFPFKERVADSAIAIGLVDNDDEIINHRNSLVLRKSAPTYFSDGNSKLAQKGALIAFTFPKDKQESYAINAGLIFGFNKVIENSEKVLFTKSVWLPYVQFDKNTLIDKEQSNLLLGISYAYNTIDFFNVNDSEKFNLVLKPQIAFRDDYENNLQALQTSITFSPQRMAISKKADKDEGKLKRVNWISKVFDVDIISGLEYDYRYNNDHPILDGNMFRTYSKATAQLKIAEELVTTLDWEYRYVLTNSTALDKDDFSLLTFKVNYRFKNSIGGSRFKDNLESIISIIHQKGTNPTNGFNDQAYWALALELKI